jgi:FKBP-type peptidyl-prolyl cis-trans isomerase
MARKRDRAFAGFGAGLFLLTSSALTIAVVYSLVQQHNSSKSSSSTTSTAASTAACTNSATQTPPATKLTGTQMQNFTPTSQPQTKLQTIDTKIGTGATVKAGDCISADYIGALMKTGTIFDASADHGGPQTFSLSQVIVGWQQGIPGMKVGGTRRLLIPAAQAYGSQAQTGIPANSDLVFDVTVENIVP